MKCCPSCGSEDIVDTSPNMWTPLYRCRDCKKEWRMIVRKKDGTIIRCCADVI